MLDRLRQANTRTHDPLVAVQTAAKDPRDEVGSHQLAERERL
jgi:hypothetical protein